MYKKIIIFLSLVIFSSCSLNINLNQPQTISPTPTNGFPPQEPQETEIPQNTPTNTVSIEKQLTNFFASKFNRPAEKAILTISQNTDTHATGGIKFEGDIAGGMWLAHIDNGIWIVDYDGNGTIACKQVEPFNYPSSIITECWDETTNNIKQL